MQSVNLRHELCRTALTASHGKIPYQTEQVDLRHCEPLQVVKRAHQAFLSEVLLRVVPGTAWTKMKSSVCQDSNPAAYPVAERLHTCSRGRHKKVLRKIGNFSYNFRGSSVRYWPSTWHLTVRMVGNSRARRQCRSVNFHSRQYLTVFDKSMAVQQKWAICIFQIMAQEDVGLAPQFCALL